MSSETNRETRSLPRRIGRAIVRVVIRLTRLGMSVLLWLVFSVSLLLLILQAPHPRHWDRWMGLVLLRKAGDYLLFPVRASLDRPDIEMFYLLALLFASSIVLIVVDSHLYWLRNRLLGKPH